MRFVRHYLNLAFALCMLCFSALAVAGTNVNAKLTADNEYWLYSGNAIGSNLHYVGHGNDWTTAALYGFTVDPGDYIYVMTLDWGQPHAWQGFFFTMTDSLYTNGNDWVATVRPNTTVNSAVISGAIWSPIAAALPYNSAPWGSRVGNVNAEWIWISDIYSADNVVLFRSADPIVAVPEPESWALLLAGLGLLGFAARRRA